MRPLTTRAAPATTTRLQLICPGLFGLTPGALLQGNATPALDRLLARADGRQTLPRDPLETLTTAFGLPPTPDLDLPCAALCLLAEAPELAHDGHWYHADPIHLRADRHRLLLFAGPSLALQPAESAALVAAFNAHFRADGLRLAAPRPGAWYLRVAAPPRLRTSALHAVTGRDLAPFLPTGADARAWNRWQNEAQMLFHQHPVNQERERLGRPTIGGVWTWGGGALPQVPGGPTLTIADHPLAAGLARAANGRLLGLDALCRDLPAGPERGSPSPPGELLIFWDGLWWPALTGDGEAWCAALADLEALVARLCAELAGARIGSLTLDDGHRWAFTLTTWGQRRVWRRGGGLRDRLGDGLPP